MDYLTKPPRDSNELLNYARNSFDQINQILLTDITDHQKIATNAAIFAYSTYLEHIYSRNNLSVGSNLQQLSYMNDRQCIHDLARLLASEKIQIFEQSKRNNNQNNNLSSTG